MHAGHFSLPHLVKKVCHAPALRFGIGERGFLREGYFADLVLVDPDAHYTVRREDVLSKCGWSPFEGESFRSRVAATFVNGEMSWDGSRHVGAVGGRRLVFAR